MAETLNFSKAASTLFISQSSLSKQIAMLENDLGTLLFRRDRQKVELTDSGRVLYMKAKDLIEEANGIPTLLSSYSSVQKGEKVLLNIGITDVLLNIPMHAKAFLNTVKHMKCCYPEVEINMVSTRMSKVKKDLSGGLVDLGIVVTDDLQNKSLTDINYTIFQEFPVYLVSSKDSGLGTHPTKEELRAFLKHKNIFIHSERARVYMQAYQICAELDARPNSISIKENPRLFLLVAWGEGVTISWNGVVEESLQEHLNFSKIPVPAAKAFAFFCWGRTDRYIQEFSAAYSSYINAELPNFWKPIEDIPE